MSQKVKALLGILGLVILIVLCVLAYNGLSKRYEPEQAPVKTDDGEKVSAPDFTVEDVDGNPVSLSDFSGKPVVINFWATWCGYCIDEMPDFDEVYGLYSDQVTFLMINATDGDRETKAAAVKHVEDKGYQFPVYYDVSQEAVVRYGVNGLPTTYILDEDGYVADGFSGRISKEKLTSSLDAVLKK